MTKIEPALPIPYEIQSRYTKIDAVDHTIETHTYVSINGGVATHKVDLAKFITYDKLGKEVVDNQPGQTLDKSV